MPDMYIVPLTQPEVDEAVELCIEAFRTDPMERYLFPEEDNYIRSWRELGPHKFRHAMENGSCWRTEKREAVIRCLPPNVTPDPNRALWRELMEKLVGSRMVYLNHLFGEIIPELRGNQPYYELSSIAVNPAVQNRGIGSSLLIKMQEIAQQNNVPIHLIASSVSNARLYNRHGFLHLQDLVIPNGPTLYAMCYQPGTPHAV